MRSMTPIALALLMACSGGEATLPGDDQPTATSAAGALARRPFPADNGWNLDISAERLTRTRPH